MSLLSELNAIAESCGVPVETGVFSDAAPDTYLVLTPLSDTFDLHADNRPGIDIQEVRLSLFTKGSYLRSPNCLPVSTFPYPYGQLLSIYFCCPYNYRLM